MLASSSAVPSKKTARCSVNEILLQKNRPAISVDDLALMLEIDLSLGCRDDFRERLQKALNAVARTCGTA